jgi:hypothetical protein
MKYRKLVTGKRVKETPTLIKWGFESRCPAKWLHIDLESGQVYIKAISITKKLDGSTIVNPWDAGWLEPTQTQIDAGRKALKDWRPR